MQLPFPFKFVRTRKCLRCTKRYKVTYEECPHCADVADGRQLEEFIRQHRQRLRANAQLGWGFLVAAALIVVLMALV